MFGELYEVADGTGNQGTTYENLFVASIALELTLDENIRDFKLSSNNKKFGKFDDVVIEIETLDGHEDHYAVQLKHGENNKTLIEFLRKNEDNFNIRRYFETYENNEFENYENVNKFKKIFFTNREFEGDDTMFHCKPESLFRECFANDENSYKFKDEEIKDSQCAGFFQAFYLYPNQLNADEMEKKLLGRFQKEFDCEKSVFLEYCKFINEWSKQKTKREKLTKCWIKNLIIARLLSPYLQPISVSSNRQDNENLNIFRQVINNFNITIFEEKFTEEIKQLWDIQQLYEETDEKKIAEIHKNVISDFRENFTVFGTSMNDLSLSLWLLNMCPLIITYNRNVIKALSLCENKNLIILFNGDIETSILEKFPSEYPIFRCLSDLKQHTSLYNKIKKSFLCSLQGKPKITLDELIGQNEEIEDWITTNKLLLSAKEEFAIGEKEEVSEFYVDRFFSRCLIGCNFLETLDKDQDKDTIVVISGLNENSELANDFEKVHIDAALLNQESKCSKQDANTKKLYVSESDCNKEKCEELCRKLSVKNYHYLKVFDNDLEWIRSKEGIEKIREFKISDRYVTEEQYRDRMIDNDIMLISGDPGLGKTITMKKFKNDTFPSSWTVLIYPKDHSKHFRENKENLIDFEKYLLSEFKSQDFDLKFFKILLENDRVNYLWDGLDEVSENNLDSVLNIIAKISRQGIKQCLTSRNNLQEQLEKRFSVLSSTIKEFDEENQRFYIKKRLKCEDSELEDILSRMTNNFQFFQYREILGIPMQIYMLTELFIQNKDKYASLLNTLVNLYEYFVEEKFNMFFKKQNTPNENDFLQHERECYKINTIDKYKWAALKTYFPDQFPKASEKCEKFLNEINGKDPIGIITSVSSDNLPNFLHNSYGEYFSALYLATNYRKIPNLSQFIFEDRHRNIRFLFDLILANSPLHIAVLCKNLKVLQGQNEDLTLKDGGGRNLLQLACSWGEAYPPLEVSDYTPTSSKEKILSLYGHSQFRIINEHPEHYKILMHLVDNCNAEQKDEVDEVYHWNAISYADKTFGLMAIAVLCKKYVISFNTLNNFNNIPTVLYYSAKYNFFHIFDSIQERPHISCEGGQSLLWIAVRYGSTESCHKLLLSDCLNSPIHFDRSGHDLLNLACSGGNIKIVELLVDHGVNVNPTNEYTSQSALNAACEKGYIDIVKLLIERGADVNRSDQHSPNKARTTTSLTAACLNGHLDVAKILIDHGAEVNMTSNVDGRSRTPLSYACKREHISVAKLLIEKGANVNCVDAFKRTPLYSAYVPWLKRHFDTTRGTANMFIKNKADFNLYDSDLITLLIESGADVNITCRYRGTPLSIACETEEIDMVKLLLKYGANVNAVNYDSCTPVYLACEKNNIQIVNCLLQQGADVNIVSTHLIKSPLHIACENGQIDMVKLLLKYDANVNIVDYSSKTPLEKACAKGYFDIVKELIQHSILDKYLRNSMYIAYTNGFIDIFKLLLDEGVNLTGDQILISAACRKNDFDTVNLLIRKGADVNVSTSSFYYRQSPLYIACCLGHINMAKLLVENKADVNYNDGCYSILYKTYFLGHKDIVKLLIRSGADPVLKSDNPLIFNACDDGHADVVKLLLEHGTNTEIKSYDEETPLYVACIKDRLEVAQVLLDKGADVNCKLKGKKLLQLLCRYPYVHKKNIHVVIELLLQKGAAVNDIDDEDGTTPLYNACRLGNIEVAKVLIEHKADINFRCGDYIKHTILYETYYNGHTEVAKLLIRHGAYVNLIEDEEYILDKACRIGDFDMVSLLIQNGAKVVGYEWYCPLQSAFYSGHANIAELLITKGAMVDVSDENKRLIIHACKKGYVDIVKLLLQNGADVNTTDEQDDPLILCACQNGRADIVKLLLQNGADANATDKQDNPLILCACQNGRADIVKLLLDKGAKVDRCEKYSKEALLFIACVQKHINVIEILIEYGANVDVFIKGNDDSTKTLLEHILQSKLEKADFDVVKILIENGAGLKN